MFSTMIKFRSIVFLLPLVVGLSFTLILLGFEVRTGSVYDEMLIAIGLPQMVVTEFNINESLNSYVNTFGFLMIILPSVVGAIYSGYLFGSSKK